VLPFVEQQALRDVGLGETVDQKRTTLMSVLSTPLALFQCPSRRRAMAYPYPHGAFRNCNKPDAVARSDYAMNAGDHLTGGAIQPYTFEEADGPNYKWILHTSGEDGTLSTGIVSYHHRIAITQVRDGTSNTYLIGEKLLDPLHYETGLDGGDNQSMYQGHDVDVFRWTYRSTPRQDRPGYVDIHSFGSAHAGSCNFVFCDGSVHAISYTIDHATHKLLSNRKDNTPIDASKY